MGFIGAPDTGLLIQRQAAEHGVKYVSLELGGKTALILLPGADLDMATDSAVHRDEPHRQGGPFVLIDLPPAAPRVDRRPGARRRCRSGRRNSRRPPTGARNQMCPVITRNQYDKSMDAITAAPAAGRTALAGGGRPDTVGPHGWYVARTMLAGHHARQSRCQMGAGVR